MSDYNIISFMIIFGWAWGLVFLIPSMGVFGINKRLVYASIPGFATFLAGIACTIARGIF